MGAAENEASLPKPVTGLLSAADIARDRGWNRVTAWRWLRWAEKEHGVHLVQSNRTLYIDAVELARVARLEKGVDWKARQEIQMLRDRLDALEMRQNGLARDLATMRRATGT